MPTLIRLLIVLVILAVLVLGGMVALTLLVNPPEKDVTIKIPARELVPPAPGADNSDPLGINVLPTPVGIAPKQESAAPPSGELAIDTQDEDGTESGVVTLEPGNAE
jgi:hypothetical protein